MTTPIALQLYTVRDLLEQDFERTLRRIADMGYVGVETANMFGASPSSAASLFKELGLTVMGAHSPLPLGDEKQNVIDTLVSLGCKRLVVPSLPAEMFTSLDGIRRACETLNEGAAVARDHGIHVGYHNHWFEYGQVEDRLPIDITGRGARKPTHVPP